MIELRWFDTMRVWPEDLDKNLRPTRVLQYRVLGTETIWHGKAGATRVQKWGDWQDVPTISAASKRSES